MNLQKLASRVSTYLPGEQVLAATKAMPRGAAHQVILGAAGAVAGGTVNPAAAGAGTVLGATAGAGPTAQGRAERAEAGVDVGRATHVLLVVTDRRIALFTTTALGKPKELVASIGRDRITSCTLGEASVFGQKMPEVRIGLDDGHEAGFGVAKVNRRDGEQVVEALG